MQGAAQQFQKKELFRMASELVRNYMLLKGQIPENSPKNNKKAARVIQVLAQDSSDCLQLEDRQISREGDSQSCPLGIEPEKEEEIMKKIGIEEYEPLQKILLSKFAQRSFELGSIDQSDRKDDLRHLCRDQLSSARFYDEHAKNETTINDPPNLRFYYVGLQSTPRPPQKKQMRTLPKCFYEQSDKSGSESGTNKSGQELEPVDHEGDILFNRVNTINTKLDKPEREYVQKLQMPKRGKVNSRKLIRKHCKNKYKRVRQAKGRRPQNPKMELKLVPWILEEVQKGQKLTQKQIRQKARELTAQLQPNRPRSFAASKGWIQKFFRRYPQIPAFVNRSSKKHPELQTHAQVSEKIDSKIRQANEGSGTVNRGRLQNCGIEVLSAQRGPEN